jgi:flagellar protein FliL
MTADEEKKEETQEKKSGGFLDNKLVLLGIIVVLQALMAFVIVQFIIAPKLAAVGTEIVQANEEAKEEEAGPSVIVSLNELVVSLQGDGRGGYLKITIDLELDSQENADLALTQLPKLRHIAIMSLTTKSVTDLQSHNGKSAFNAELLRKFGDVLPQDALMSVFFSDLVIQ